MLKARSPSWLAVTALAAFACAAMPAPASAQDVKFDEKTAIQESQAATTVIIKILVGGVLVIVLIAAVIYGVARGMTKGDWGFFAACVIAVIVSVLAVKGIGSFFGIDLQTLMKQSPAAQEPRRP